MANKNMMVIVFASSSFFVVLVLGVLAFVFRDKLGNLFGKKGDEPGPTKDGPYAPAKYHKYVCPVVMDGDKVKGYSTWGRGDAKDKCCLYQKGNDASSVDNSKASNCTVTPFLVDKVTVFNWPNFEASPFKWGPGYHYDTEGKPAPGEDRPTWDTASMYVPPNHEVEIWTEQDGRAKGTPSFTVKEDMASLSSVQKRGGGGTENITDRVEAMDIRQL